MELSQEKIREFLTTLKKEVDAGEELTLDTNLRAQGYLDSLTVLGIVALLDEKYGKTISSDNLLKARTPGDILRLLEE